MDHNGSHSGSLPKVARLEAARGHQIRAPSHRYEPPPDRNRLQPIRCMNASMILNNNFMHLRSITNIYIYIYINITRCHIYIYVYIYMIPPSDRPQWDGSPGSTPPFPSICKLLAAFLRSSLVFARFFAAILTTSHAFTRYMLPFRRPTSHTYSLKEPTCYL